MTNTTGSELTVTFGFSGAAADDFAWTFESGCPSPSDASGKVVPLATKASRARWTCTSIRARSARGTPI